VRGSRKAVILASVFAAALGAPARAPAYAVYTHAELVDLVWDSSVRPLLLERYPDTTEAMLREAHAFAYGGATIQDLGYYPFGKKFFSELTHYVRSGDFVNALLRNARNVNEYAFAIGALSHYVGDMVGHSEAVNPSTARTFPELESRYGAVVTFEDDPIAHGRTEFGFDIAQLARRRYASHAYREFIGFRVARGLVEQAFYETYGLPAPSVLGPPRSAVASYRLAARSILPLFARVEVINMRGRLPEEALTPDRHRFLEYLARAEYARRWNGSHRGPGVGAHVLAVVIRIIPKIGVLKILSLRTPTPETEEAFIESVNHAAEHLAALLKLASDTLPISNRDLDTGDKVKPGAYALTDKAYAHLLGKVVGSQNPRVPAGLREDILAYYSDPAAPIRTKRNRTAWTRVQAQLEILKRSAPTAEGAESPDPDPNLSEE
jgi:hypothetical protein